MDKELWYTYIHNGILFSYKKEHIWVSSNELDEPRAYYTEWSKSERETQILYINAYIWNLERWYQWSYMWGNKGDRDVNNRILDSVGEGEGGMIWENSTETSTLPYVKQMTSTSSMNEAGYPKLVLWDNQRDRVGRGFRMGEKHVYLWLIHADIWQNHCITVK